MHHPHHADPTATLTLLQGRHRDLERRARQSRLAVQRRQLEARRHHRLRLVTPG